MSAPPDLRRRTLFGLAAGSALTGRMPGMAPVRVDKVVATDRMVMGQAPDGRHSGPALIVAGPQDGELAGLARRLSAPLAAGLMSGAGMDVRYGGGIDGVTQANQFDARMSPDGEHALLFPGSVAQSWLTGDGRVRLEPAHMLPLLAAFGPGLLMVRGALPAPGRGGRLRLVVGPGQDALTAILGLDLLGIGVTRVAGTEAAGAGRADAVFLHGAGWRARVAALRSAGFAPALSAAEDRGAAAWPELRAPSFLAAVTRAQGQSPLVAAWRALAAASSVCAVLVVPRISPAEAIGRWRHAAGTCLSDSEVGEKARSQGVLLEAGDGADAAFSPMRADAPALLALRRWVGQHRAG